MATKKITYPSFMRGDTPTFRYDFTPPSSTFSWSGVTVDWAITSQTNPVNNASAAAVRTGLTPTIGTVNNVANTATILVTLTPTESNAPIPGTTYKVEPQLKQGSLVNTPVTGSVLIEQDSII